MNSVFQLTRSMRLAVVVIVLQTFLLFSQSTYADTIVNLNFDDSTDLANKFNRDSGTTNVINASTGGIENSGVINASGGQNKVNVWTSRTGYSVSGVGDSYRLSAFFRLSSSRGFAGLGISTNNISESAGEGYTSSGIGYIATNSTVSILSSINGSSSVDQYDFTLSVLEELFEDGWYQFEISVLATAADTFDVSVVISNADVSGNVGSVVKTFTQTDIINSDMAQVSTVYPYFSISSKTGSRFDRLDELSIRLSGGPVVVSDPNADSDDDGELDITDSDDDNDGTDDEFDAFPLDANESGDNDGDGIGDQEDLDDDNDGIPDTEDSTPNGGAEPVDTDMDGVPDIDDRFPNDADESVDTDNDGVGDNGDAFPNDASETMDSDNDGVGDNADAFPNDATETMDSDNDGVGDNADAFPNDATETTDSDNDNVGDNADAFPNDASETTDTDNDNVGDNSDAFPNDATETTDTDNDNVGDNSDAFPNDASESADSDGDGVGDNADAFPGDPTETMDSDSDGVGNNADVFPADPLETHDTDNDGVGDNADAFPTDPSETMDSDGDGIGDNSDAFPNDPDQSNDSDGDGVADVVDAFDNDPTETTDTDGDGVGDNADVFPSNPAETNDTDNDGVGDNADVFPSDPAESTDTDSDGVGDNADVFPTDPTETIDSDEDGVGDNADVFPTNPNETIDTDSDGVGDNADVFPADPTETSDTDNDGVGNNTDVFPTDPTETIDTDGDGVGDNADAFPTDPAETMDADDDGVGDNADRFPGDPLETMDSDNDGIGDNSDPTPLGEIPPNDMDQDQDGVADSLDAFPLNANEWLDTDGDGLGNNSDAFDNDPTETTDTDNDGIGDNADRFPQNPDEQNDIDNDGIGDNADTDNDNDGTPDIQDAFPLNSTEQIDTDSDGIGDIADTDDDNDGVLDVDDRFPELASESIDTDNDGTGDNSDLDDDNDGVSDQLDAFPLNSTESEDSDRDGLGNNADTDDDNDGYTDEIELLYQSDSLNARLFPQDLDMDRDSIADSLERGSDADRDGISDEFDVDSDNDGIFDLLEASDQPSLAALADANSDGMMDDTALIGLMRIDFPIDTDKDGIRDFRDLDADNDGISDFAETSASDTGFIVINGIQNDLIALVLADPDGDKLVNFRDLDSDNDGVPDLVEAGGIDQDGNGLADDFLDLNADGMDDSFFSVPLMLIDTDADGERDYVDLDSNNDGIFDIENSKLVDADLNGDGRVDIGSDSNANGISDYADVSITNGEDSDSDGIDDRLDASVLGEPDSDSDGIADRYDADNQGDGFIQVSNVKLPALVQGVTEPSTPIVAPAEPVAPIIANTAISGGGCSIASSGQPDMTLTALLVFSTIYLILVHAGTIPTLKRALLVFLSTSLAAGPTMADVQTGLYLGIGGGASRLMPGIENAQLTDRDSVGTTWNALAGYQINPSFGIELEYSNLGTTTLDPVGYIDYQDINVSGLYHLGGSAQPNGSKKYSLYGRLGIGKISNESNIQLERGSSAHWLAGVGIQVPVSSRLSLRAEGINYDADVSRVGMSLTYKMGKISLPSLPTLSSLRLPFISKEPTEAAKIALAQDTEESIISDSNVVFAGDPIDSSTTKQSRPYYIDAALQEPYTMEFITVEQMMATPPEPETRTLVSTTATKSMLIKPAAEPQIQNLSVNYAVERTDVDQQPVLASALPLPSKMQATEADAVTEAPVIEPVLFGFGQSSTNDVIREKLQPLVDYLRGNPASSVTLTGHTDSVGSDEHNQILSVRRAETIAQFLLLQGIDKKMIRVLGAGEKRPVQSNGSLAGRKANRRVNIVVN